MPPRPSRNLDLALLQAGRELFPDRGCAAMSVREVAEKAGVNLGMFHYHFKSRDAYLRSLMQLGYEEMFSKLTLVDEQAGDTVERLRYALRTISRFVRDNRRFVARLLTDALNGEAIARDFLHENLPRHLSVVRGLIAAGQREGAFAPVPVPQAMGVCVGSLAFPVLAGGAMVDSGMLDAQTVRMIDTVLVSNEALDQRIEMAIRGISQSKPVRARRAKPSRGKK